MAGAAFGVSTLVSRCHERTGPLVQHTLYTMPIDDPITPTISQMVKIYGVDLFIPIGAHPRTLC